MPYTGQQTDYRSKLIATAIVIAFATTLGASSGHTATNDDFRFEYRAYELTSESAAAALYRRVAGRLRVYCADPGVLSATRARRAQTCRNEMLGRTVRKLNSDRLSAIHRRQTNSAG